MMRPRELPEWPLDDPRRGPVARRKDLIALGYTDRSLHALVKAAVLSKPRRGAYADSARYDPLDEGGKYAVRTRAVMLQAGTEVIASHTSTVPEYDGPVWGLDLSDTHLTRIDGKAGRNEAGVQQHCGKLIDGDVIERNGISMTAPTRAALEVTTVARVEPSLVFVVHLLHRGATTHEKLAKRYASMEQWPNSLRTDLVLRLADDRLESVGEVRFFYFCFRHSIPLPVPQYEVRDDWGLLVARVDFAWPDLGIYLEFDGKIKYQKLLKPGENVTDAVVREKQRESLISRLTGWRCIRITWADLENPARLLALITAELNRAA